MLPSDILGYVLTFLDIRSLYHLQKTCKQYYQDLYECVPNELSTFVVPYVAGDLVQYPYMLQGRVKSIDSRILDDEHHFDLLDRLLSTLNQPYLRLWLWKKLRARSFKSVRTTLNKGLLIPSQVNWCCQNRFHLWSYSRRNHNNLSWLHLKSFPDHIQSQQTIGLLLRSCRTTLTSLLVQSLPSSFDMGQALLDGQCTKLKSLVIRRYVWKLPTRLPEGLIRVNVSATHFHTEGTIDSFLKLPRSVRKLCLHNITCSTGDVENVIARATSHFGKLHGLKLDTVPMSESVVHGIATNVTSLRRLSIQHTTLNNTLLERAISNLHGLVALDLPNNELGSSVLRTVGLLLFEPSCRLKRLNLASNFISNIYMTEFTGALRQNTSLTHLNIGDNYIRYAGYSTFYSFLTQDTPKLTYLNISANQICLFGNQFEMFLAFDVAVLLAKCPSLKNLDVSCNSFIPYTLRCHLEQQFWQQFQAHVTL